MTKWEPAAAEPAPDLSYMDSQLGPRRKMNTAVQGTLTAGTRHSKPPTASKKSSRHGNGSSKVKPSCPPFPVSIHPKLSTQFICPVQPITPTSSRSTWRLRMFRNSLINQLELQELPAEPSSRIHSMDIPPVLVSPSYHRRVHRLLPSPVSARPLLPRPQHSPPHYHHSVGYFRKSAAQKMLRIDVNKTGKLFMIFGEAEWIPEAEGGEVSTWTWTNCCWWSWNLPSTVKQLKLNKSKRKSKIKLVHVFNFFECVYMSRLRCLWKQNNG